MKKQNETRPADPVILRGPNAGNGEVIELPPDDYPAQLKLQAFPEGDIFRYQEHPAAEEAGTFVIYDASKKPIAFTQNPAIARLFCDAVRMVFAAAEEFRKQTPPGNPRTEEGKGSTGVETMIESPVMES